MARKYLEAPCGRCGWRFEGFHICFDRSTPVAEENVISKVQRTREMSDDHKQAIADAQRDRWAKLRAETRERDENIVQLYQQGDLSTRDISDKLSVGYGTVVKVLREAAAVGLVTMRPRGINLRWQKGGA